MVISDLSDQINNVSPCITDQILCKVATAILVNIGQIHSFIQHITDL